MTILVQCSFQEVRRGTGLEGTFSTKAEGDFLHAGQIECLGSLQIQQNSLKY